MDNELEYSRNLSAEREAHAVTKAEMAWWKTRYKGMADQYCEEAVKVIVLNTALGACKESLATAERDRDRWMEVHAREWSCEVFPLGMIVVEDSHGDAIASGPTFEAALDAAFAAFLLEPKC